MSQVDVGLTQEGEPVVARTVVAIVMSVLADALVAAGVHASPSVTALIAGVVNLLVLAGLAYAVRRKVFSPATVANIVAGLIATRPPEPIATSSPGAVVLPPGAVTVSVPEPVAPAAATVTYADGSTGPAPAPVAVQ